MALQWSNTSKHALKHGIKVCAYGLAGTGKTHLIKTAPRPVIASAEAGTLSIASSNIPMAEIRTLKDLQDFYSWCVTSAEASNYDTVCIDSWSEIAQRILQVEKVSTKDGRKAYGDMQDHMEAMVRWFRDMPGKHVYITAKAQLCDTPEGTMWRPMMPGKQTAQGLPYYFDEFFHVDVGETPSQTPGQPPVRYHYLRTRKEPLYEAKDRSGALEPIERPDLAYIFDKISKHCMVAAVPAVP